MVLDWLFGWRDRRWLERNGMEHDIEIEDDLEDELSASDVRAMDDALSAMDDLLEEYDPGIYELEEIDEDSEAAGRYNGRSLGRPQIELDPDASVLPLWTHELGHDVASSSGILPDETTLVRKTFDETVAYLTAYQVMDEMDRDEPSWLGPFRYTHRPEWDRLREAADPDRYDALDDIEDAIERRDWDGMAEVADGFALQSPEGSERVEDTSMVEAYVGDRREQDLEILVEMWRDMEYASDTRAAWMLGEKVQGPEEPLEARLAVTVRDHEDDELTKIYTDVMEEAVTGMVDDLGGRDLEGLDGERVIELFADETYGYTAPRHDGYDDYLDLPHSVGTALAEELYGAGIGVPEIIEDPGTYADLARETLEYTVDHALDGGSREGYDPGELL